MAKASASARCPAIEVVDGDGPVLAPGLVDIRVKTGEPGRRAQGDAESAGAPPPPAASPPSSSSPTPSRRSTTRRWSTSSPAAPATSSWSILPRRRRHQGLEGERLAEIGLMRRGRRRRLHRRRPADRQRQGAAPGAGLRQGLRRAGRPPPGRADARRRGAHDRGRVRRRAWACPASRRSPRCIMLERDLALAELTGGRLHRRPDLDRRRPGGDRARAKARGLRVTCAPPRSTTWRSTRSTSATTAPSARSTRRCAARTTARR